MKKKKERNYQKNENKGREKESCLFEEKKQKRKS